MRALLKEIEALPTRAYCGGVASIERRPLEVTGAAGAVRPGAGIRLTSWSGNLIPRDGVGSRDARALLMPPGILHGCRLGVRADSDDRPATIYPSRAWLGPLQAPTPSADARAHVRGKLNLGMRALNAFAICYPHIDSFLAQKSDKRAKLREGYVAPEAIAGAGKGRA